MFSQNTFDAFDYDWILEKCFFTVTNFNDNLGFVKIAIFIQKEGQAMCLSFFVVWNKTSGIRIIIAHAGGVGTSGRSTALRP